MTKANVTETVVGRSLRAVVLENDWLSSTVVLDQGADILTLVYVPKGIDVLWKPPRPPRDPGVGPTPSGDSFALWLAHYRGGWQTIFPNFGQAVEYKEALLDFHGEAARIPWQLEAVDDEGEQIRLTVGVRLLKSPFRIQRVMALAAHQPQLTISETITNEGPEPMECMWGHHPTFGAPFLSSECVIDTGARAIESDDSYNVSGNDLPLGQTWAWPQVNNRQGNAVDLSRPPAPGSGYSRVLFLKDFQESWYAITNPTLGFGVGVVWDGALFPYACFWQESGGVRQHPFYGAAYATAIEPNSSYPGQGLRAAIQKTGTQLTFEPGQSLTLKLIAVFYEGHQRVAHIDPQGHVTRR
jgi:galactose mutarotase-like enzyme